MIKCQNYDHGDAMRMNDIEGTWLRVLRRYFGFVLMANLFWEFAHMKLYTLWEEGSVSEIVFAAVHCTGGDGLIATVSLMLVLLFFGKDWPLRPSKYLYVAVLVILLGLGYTIFSEWLNIVVRKSWEYSELMPMVPVLDVGLTPFLQWIIIPTVGFWYANQVIDHSQ